MHRAGPGERGGASYGRRAVATAEWAGMQISVEGKRLTQQRTVKRTTGSGRPPNTKAEGWEYNAENVNQQAETWAS